MVGDALIRHLEQQPVGFQRTVRIFASMHAALTDSLISCGRLKYDVGFWRQSQAIAGAATDGNDATVAEAGWTPLVCRPVLLRLRQRARVPDRTCHRGHPPDAGRDHPTRAALGEQPKPQDIPHPQRFRARRLQRSHLVRTPLPDRNGRRVRHRASNRRPVLARLHDCRR